MSKCVLEPLTKDYCRQVAQLHIEGIATGFISSLGLEFVTALYEAIAEDADSFGFVAVEDGQVAGFAAFSTSLSRLYRQVMLRKGLRCVRALSARLFSLQTVKKVWENLFYPSAMKKRELPDAELLSIVVAAQGRGKGYARRLVEAGLEEFRRRGVKRVKVLVADFNVPANRLYQTSGFRRVCQIRSHGVVSNVYVAGEA